jgi:hypothetical protein
LDMIESPIKSQDEFAAFSEVLKRLHAKDPAYINNLVAQMPENQKKYLKEHIETKRIKVEVKGVEQDVARRIIKVKRRAPAK